MGYRAVIFDLFDTLVWVESTGQREKAVALLESVGVSQEQWRRGWQASFQLAERGKVADIEERVSAALRVAGAPPLAPQIAEELVGLLGRRWRPVLYPDVPAAVAELRARGYRLGLISNLCSDEKGTLAAVGLPPLLDAIVASCEVGMAKPDTGIYLLAAERLGMAPEECVFVDDQPPYLAGAMRVGMCGVRIERPNQRDYDGSPDTNYDVRVQNLRQLLDWLPARAGE